MARAHPARTATRKKAAATRKYRRARETAAQNGHAIKAPAVVKAASSPIVAPAPTGTHTASAPARTTPRVSDIALKGTKLQRTRALLVRNMAQRQGKKCLMVLVDTMEDKALDPRTRMMAAMALLDRGFGKAAQEVQHTGKDGEPFRAIIELPPNFRAAPQPVMIEANTPIDAEHRELTHDPGHGVIDATYIPDDDDVTEFDDDEYEGDSDEEFDL